MGRAGVFFPSPSLSLSSLARVRRFGPPFRLLTSSFSRSRAAWLCVTSRDTRLPPSAPSSWDSSRTIGSRLWMSRGRGRNERRVPRPDMMGRVCMSASVCLCVSVCVLRAGLSGRRGRAAAEGGGRERTCAGAGGEREMQGPARKEKPPRGRREAALRCVAHPTAGWGKAQAALWGSGAGKACGLRGRAHAWREREREGGGGAGVRAREWAAGENFLSFTLSLSRGARARAPALALTHTHTHSLSLSWPPARAPRPARPAPRCPRRGRRRLRKRRVRACRVRGRPHRPRRAPRPGQVSKRALFLSLSRSCTSHCRC